MCSLLVGAEPAFPATHGVPTPYHCIVALQSHLPHSSADSDSQENLVMNTMPRDTAISSPTSVMVRVSAGLMSAGTWRTLETVRIHRLGTTTTLPRSDRIDRVPLLAIPIAAVAPLPISVSALHHNGFHHSKQLLPMSCCDGQNVELPPSRMDNAQTD